LVGDITAIDAQASGNVAQVYPALRDAAGHMGMIANPLADAIVKQFPARYSIWRVMTPLNKAPRAARRLTSAIPDFALTHTG
jgi:hypothetical protein